MDFFKKFSELSGKELPDPSTLDLQDKWALAHQLELVGESKTAIARYFGVSRPTIYNYLKKATEEKITELENQTYLEKFMQRIHELEAQRDYHRKIMERIRSGGEGNEVDPATGELIPKTTHLRNLAEIGRLVRDYDKTIIDLEIIVGLIPKNNPSELFTTLRDKDPNAESDEVDLVDMNSDEVSAILLQKLRQRAPKLGTSSLKDLKNEPVI